METYVELIKSFLKCPKGSVDIILCETLSAFIEVIYICRAIKVVRQDYIKCNDKESLTKLCNLAIIFSFSLQMNGLLQSGESLNDVISAMLGTNESGNNNNENNMCCKKSVTHFVLNITFKETVDIMSSIALK